MISLPAAPAERHEALRAEIAGFQALIKVLAAEADALRRADADALSILCASKLEHVSTLQALARERTQEMKRTGLPDNAAGVQDWLAGAGDVASVRADWQALTALALAAKHQNDVNGVSPRASAGTSTRRWAPFSRRPVCRRSMGPMGAHGGRACRRRIWPSDLLRGAGFASPGIRPARVASGAPNVPVGSDSSPASSAPGPRAS